MNPLWRFGAVELSQFCGPGRICRAVAREGAWDDLIRRHRRRTVQMRQCLNGRRDLWCWGGLGFDRILNDDIINSMGLHGYSLDFVRGCRFSSRQIDLLITTAGKPEQ